MSLRKRDLSWPVVALFGAGAFLLALDYPIGTITNIGSAVYPMILSGVIVVVSLYSFFFVGTEPNARLAPRPMLAIIASVLLFSLVVEPFGLGPAVILSMLAAYAGQSERGYIFMLGYAILFAVGTWALFSYALDLPLPIVRMP